MEIEKSPGIDKMSINIDKEFHNLFKNDLLQLYNTILLYKKQSQKTRNQALVT